MFTNAKMTLSSICNGALEEIFQAELQKVLENVDDVNAKADAKRSLSITFEFKPFKDRNGAELTLRTSSKLVPRDPVETSVYIKATENGMEAFVNDPRQQQMFNEELAQNVTKMPGKTQAG